MPRSERELLDLVYRRSAALRLRRRAAATATCIAVALVAVLLGPPLLRLDQPTGVDMIDAPATTITTWAPAAEHESQTDDDGHPQTGPDRPLTRQARGATAPVDLPGALAPGPAGVIVFEGEGDIEGRRVLYRVGADGSAPAQLTTGATPRWSPDGTRLAFVDHDVSTAVFVINADGTNRRRVTPADVAAYDPQWSPDGTHIVFVAAGPDPTGVYCCTYAFPPVGFTGKSNISVVHVDTLATTPLTTGEVIEYVPRWSPDGSRVAFFRYGAGVYSIGVDALDERVHWQRSSESITGLAWSPLGDWIALTQAAGEDMNDDVLWITATKQDETRLLDRGAYGDTPVWAPDGRAIAFARDYDTVRIVALDGSTLQGISGRDPTFAPDGGHIAYCREDGLWHAGRDGSNAALLLAAEFCASPTWSPSTR